MREYRKILKVLTKTSVPRLTWKRKQKSSEGPSAGYKRYPKRTRINLHRQRGIHREMHREKERERAKEILYMFKSYLYNLLHSSRKVANAKTSYMTYA